MIGLAAFAVTVLALRFVGIGFGFSLVAGALVGVLVGL